MRKLLVVLAALMAVAVLGVAQGLPNQVEAWRWVEGTGWVSMANDGVEANAWAFTSDGIELQRCNKKDWTVEFTVHVSVAQWIEWRVNATKWKWYVRKPGEYAADCITLEVKSNGPVELRFTMPEIKRLPNQEIPGVKEIIESWYGVGMALPETWYQAPLDDELVYTFEDSDALHGGINTKLWNRIKVVECNSVCEYEAKGTLKLTLGIIKPWIDPETGFFDEDYTNY